MSDIINLLKKIPSIVASVSMTDIRKILFLALYHICSERKCQIHHRESLESIRVFDLNDRLERRTMKHRKMPLSASFLSRSHFFSPRVARGTPPALHRLVTNSNVGGISITLDQCNSLIQTGSRLTDHPTDTIHQAESFWLRFPIPIRTFLLDRFLSSKVDQVDDYPTTRPDDSLGNTLADDPPRQIPLFVFLLRSVDKRFLRLTIGACPCRDAHFSPAGLHRRYILAFHCTVAQGASVVGLTTISRAGRGIVVVVVVVFNGASVDLSLLLSLSSSIFIVRSVDGTFPWSGSSCLPVPSRRYVHASGYLSWGLVSVADLSVQARTGVTTTTTTANGDDRGCIDLCAWSAARSAPTCLNANLNADSSPCRAFPSQPPTHHPPLLSPSLPPSPAECVSLPH